MEKIFLLKGLLSPLIAIIAVYIAFQQYKINKQKVNLALYEKRFVIYETIKALLMQLKEAPIKPNDLLYFETKVKEAKFLFGNDVNDYISEIISNTDTYNEIHDKLNYCYYKGKNEKDQEYQVLLTKSQQLNNWFISKYNELENLFLKYLNFRNISKTL